MKNKKMIIIIACTVLLIVLTLLIGNINLSIQFNREVKELFAGSKTRTEKVFHQQQLHNLPEPVQRYFKYVLKEGQPYISCVRMTHDGQFKTGLKNNWIPITGEQYATTEIPGFIWKGTTTMFKARDMYIGGKGRLIVSLFSLYNIVDARGDQYNQGELLRWLGESVLYPTNLLPSEKLQWLPVDSLTARLTFKYNGLSLFFIITFNETGEITQMETKRYMDEKNLETWVIKIANYKEINAVVVPTRFKVLWRLAKGDFSYAKFNMTEIEYNKPEKF